MSVFALADDLTGSVLGGRAFSPRKLFAAGEQGVWYDPSDLTTLFTDVAGTTRVTAAGQAVALMLDKSGRGNHATQSVLAARPIYRVDAGGRPYLEFDGTDDSMATSAIDFTATDKMSVFAGVRVIGSNLGIIAELGVDSLSGDFRSFTNSTPNAFHVGLRGASNSGAQITSTRALPYSAVLAASLNGAGADLNAQIDIRVNGVADEVASSGFATGSVPSFGNRPLYIGRRGSASLPFNGSLYGLVVRGAASSDTQIRNAEAWLNRKTGAY